MKLQVRSGVFETNSSSTHSLAISTEKGLKLKFPKKVVFKYGEFGWEERTLKSTKDKASYLYTAIFYFDAKIREQYIRFIFDTLVENNIECHFDGDIKYTVSTWGFDRNNPSIYFSENIDGYIDHAENLGFIEKICTDKQLLLSYLFSEHSFIKTGNDNSASDISINVNYDHQEFYKGN